MFKWYIVQTQSGFETKVSDVILSKCDSDAFGSLISESFVPKTKLTQIRRGKKTIVEKSIFPGYVLVKIDLSDQLLHFIKSIPKVSGFLGGELNPSVISDLEVEKIYNSVSEIELKGETTIDFVSGETVKITDGPFESFVGVIDSIDTEKNQIKVLVSIFGRETPVILEYTQVEKV